MTREQFLSELKIGNIAPVYLFYGEEQYAARRVLARLRAALQLPEGFDDLNYTALDGAPAARIIDAAETMPFMCGRRLVVAYDWPPLVKGKTRNEAEDTALMTEWLRAPPPFCCLVFYLRELPDGRGKMIGELKKNAAWVEFKYLSDGEIAKWAANWLAPHKKRISPRALAHLIFLAGRSLTGLEAELGKLAAYAGERGEITEGDIDELAAPSGEANAFKLIDHILMKKRLEARRLVKAMLDSGETYVRIISLLASQYRSLTHVKLLRDAGKPLGEIERELSMNHYAATRVAAQASRMTADALQARYRACVEADYAIKSGAARDEAAFETLLVI